MKVSDEDAKLFFDLMWGVQFFVNQKNKIHSNIKSLEEYIECSTEEKMEVRTALYSDITIIDSYVKENPQKLSEDKLAIISAWKTFVQGDFYIERYLKRCAMFIKDDTVYGVLGLHQSVEEVIPRYRLPMYVKAVLLPFKGKIIYDGLFLTHNVFFGGGIKRNLKESYMKAKQNNRIIESFDVETKNSPQKKINKENAFKDWSPELDEIAKASKKMRGKATDPAIFSPAFSLLKASIEFAQIAVSEVNNEDDLYKALNKVKRAYNKTHTVIRRQEYQ